jgi:hypothetical protein
MWCRSAVNRIFGPLLPLHILAPAHWARRSGSASGARFAGVGSPSLRLLLRRLGAGLVRRLLRYYGTVRLPMPVHYRRMSLDFPDTACRSISRRRYHGTSRFSSKVFPYMRGVCDRARPVCISRWRCIRCGLHPCPTTSASRRSALSRLNTRPARTPVNASAPPRGGYRMTRGQRGSLILRRMALSSTTPRRFIPAHGTPAPLAISDHLGSHAA